MSMVRGKLEAIRDISTQNLVVGDLFFVKKGEKWYNPSEPNTEIKVDVYSLEDLENDFDQKVVSAFPPNSKK